MRILGEPLDLPQTSPANPVKWHSTHNKSKHVETIVMDCVGVCVLCVLSWMCVWVCVYVHTVQRPCEFLRIQCVRVYVCVRLRVWVYVCVYIYGHFNNYGSSNSLMCVCVCVCARVYVFVDGYVCVNVNIYSSTTMVASMHSNKRIQ